MNKRYIFLAALFILVGFGAMVFSEKFQPKEVSPETLFREMNDPSRFVSTDILAQKIIEGDPAIQLVDTRSPEQYNAYTLPGAINISLEELIDSSGSIQSNWLDYLDMDGIETVFFSNGDVCADQAWILCSRLNINNIHILKGGLNCWVETILRPIPPAVSDPESAFELYDFRKGASLYFGGGPKEIQPVTNAKKVVILHTRKKKTVVSGGC